METDWLLDAILTGLQKLYPLSLDRTPAAEILPGTAMAWLEAISFGRSWEQSRDESRIRGAFVTLAQTCDRWPSPKQFLAALPDSTQLRIAGPTERPADPPELRAAMEAIKRGETWPPLIEGVPATTRDAGLPRLNLDAVERDLRSHYDRKSAAAGDA